MGEWADYWYGDEDMENPTLNDDDLEVIDVEDFRDQLFGPGFTRQHPTRWFINVRVSSEYL